MRPRKHSRPGSYNPPSGARLEFPAVLEGPVGAPWVHSLAHNHSSAERDHRNAAPETTTYCR